MKKDIKQMVREYNTCQIVKYENTPQAGLLQLLPIHCQAWKDISIDFIEGLPTSQGHNVIMVVIDQFTKFDHFIPLSHPYTVTRVAQLFINNIFKLYGLPKIIVSDQDPMFLSSFWTSLFSLQETELNHNSAYHLQGTWGVMLDSSLEAGPNGWP